KRTVNKFNGLCEWVRDVRINMVEDRDLWRFQYEGSKRLHYALTCMDPTPDCFAHQMQLSIQNPDYLVDLLRQGAAMEKLFDAQVETLKREAFPVEIGGARGAAR